MIHVSVVIPAYNEEASVAGVVRAVRKNLNDHNIAHQIVIVVDGATDNTEAVAREHADLVIVHPQNLGYGQSLKSGIVAAKHDLIAITDADQTYPVDRLPQLIDLAQKFDMVVGARTGSVYRGSMTKWIGRFVFRQLSQFSAGRSIPDINSGMRVFRRSMILRFLPVISAGFSFTTTATLAYMHNQLTVHYISIAYHKREGRSKVRHLRDSLRSLQIITEAILRYNPIKLFILLAAPLAMAAAICVLFSAVGLGAASFIAGVIFASAAVLVMAVGFLAVALLPQREFLHSQYLMGVNQNEPTELDSTT
ncbi:glycosyltransferase family 2 protein [Rubripirellula amarantea]|uniref:Undecaprenyl-phosphate 4-deoxy-4-formamido-L-arabinose transferase n=1 Tax=Rubripirellula amarantea TaxID=2527999 RepID=A0A5C5WI94_9BACT|nr:glycosyltransferase family 2 protein [Rubripirellula amarantea]MDA8743258.1 glycosyltransferase family 2 protein [Rubripirellula amarantea]TWT49522.1 Undecaprenyl-phosphate 4-deoxy-4-formamido-L-arabinose transferase [Rubripirellula amarantea]